MKTAIVTGHTSGLGLMITDRLVSQGWDVTGWSLDSGVDVRDDISVKKAAADSLRAGPFNLLINCAGVNYINWHEDTPLEEWDRVMDTNALALWLTTKELLKVGAFNRPATILNIVSNASHKPMTNSAAYNASKGAAHILTLQMDRELRPRHGISVFGISPNKLAGTGMSNYIDERVCELRGWTREQADAYQRSALPAGEETDPGTLAEFIAFLVSTRQRHKYLAGTVIPYGA